MTIITGITIISVPIDFSKMFIVHFVLIVLVAIKTGEQFSVIWIKMACSAIIPFVVMWSGENWEELTIMLYKVPFFTLWMAKITLRTVEGITLNPRMLNVHFTLAVLMTVQTGKVFTVRWIWMTGEAFLPLSGVYACEDGKE
ncbi:MAG: hypothetical protein ACE5NG_12030 [bacterium]